MKNLLKNTQSLPQEVVSIITNPKHDVDNLVTGAVVYNGTLGTIINEIKAVGYEFEFTTTDDGIVPISIKQYESSKFWSESGITELGICDLPEAQCLHLVNNVLTRKDIIAWLDWNDHNGVFNDADSISEFGNILSIEDGREIMLRNIEESK